MMKYNKKKIWYMTISSIVLLGLAVIIDQSTYPDKIEEWYRVQRLKYNMRCQGDSLWLATVAIEAIKQPNHDDLTNVSLAYISPEGELSTCVSGWYDSIGDSTEINTDTVYQFASVTKTFTSDIILNLVRQDKINLHDKLVDILPELHNIKYIDNRINDITVSHLLSHTAGFDRTILGISDNMFEPHPWCPEHVEQLGTVNLQFPPNSRMSYSNTGYCLLSRIAEEKYQKPYRDIVRERYHLSDYGSFDFVTDNESLPDKNSAIKPLYTEYDYEALSSAAGLYGDASSLVKLVHGMEKSLYPNITDHPSGSKCDVSKVKGCHGYMGYEYAPDPNLHFYWRDGGMVAVSTLLIIDDKGGVMAVLTNVRKKSKSIKQLVEFTYQYRLKQNTIS